MTGAANTLTYYQQRPAGWARLVVHPDGTGTYTDPLVPAGEPWGVTTVVSSLARGNWNDGWESDDEYLDNVACADCGETRVDLLRCDQCDVVDCTVKPFSCDGGGAPDGQDLCDEHTPRHSGCPHCDPRMPWEE